VANYRLQPLLLAVLGVIALPLGAAQMPQGQSAVAAPEGNTALVRISSFQVKGNTLLDDALIERLLEPYKGDNRSYTDIQEALETLEGAYRAAGYSAVHVVTPEQEITNGTVTLQVIETTVGKVTISGNQYYDKDNIRAALPALLEGKTPSARDMSQNIRLANENPTRQIDVVLAIGDSDNTVDANVNVQDSSPHRFFATLDNTGSPSTGMFRAGVGYQNNNLFNRDQAATLSYITSPGHVSDITQVSASYRIPLYTLGDSIDLIASHSSANIGTATTVAGPLAVSNGNSYSARYNHYLPRAGEYTAKIIGGLDYRISNCSENLTASPTNCQAPAGPLTVHPLSIAYNGTLTKASSLTDFSVAVEHNLPGGNNGGQDDFTRAVGANASASYNIARLNGSVAGSLPEGWQYRVAGNAQLTQDILTPSEGIGLVGAAAVRGFIEREINTDKGYVLNVELYTPELAPQIKLESGSFRLLGFVDHAAGWNDAPLNVNRSSAGSVGVGMRLTYGKGITAKLDLAQVAELSTPSIANINTKSGDRRGMLSVVASW
jgi:hemolysin activation/secretion protein